MTEPYPITRILGWDAAWTPGGTGAWCLLKKSGGDWKVGWNRVCPTGLQVLEELEHILQEEQPDLIAIDLPIGREPVRGYREADRATTRAFSRYGCPVHSPTPDRPGQWGDRIQDVLKRAHVKIATDAPVKGRSAVEVYPHTVCLDILRSSYRVPYKIQRAARLYPDRSPAGRRQAIADMVHALLNGVQALGVEVPDDLWEVPSLPLRHWKTREDRVDALLCAVAGIGSTQGRFLPFGNIEAAIWNPDLKHLVPSSPIR